MWGKGHFYIKAQEHVFPRHWGQLRAIHSQARAEIYCRHAEGTDYTVEKYTLVFSLKNTE